MRFKSKYIFVLILLFINVYSSIYFYDATTLKSEHQGWPNCYLYPTTPTFFPFPEKCSIIYSYLGPFEKIPAHKFNEIRQSFDSSIDGVMLNWYVETSFYIYAMLGSWLLTIIVLINFKFHFTITKKKVDKIPPLSPTIFSKLDEIIKENR